MKITINDDAKNWSPVISLHRYFVWSETMRERYFQWIVNLPPLGESEWYSRPVQEIFAVMSYWYGSLYVVVEGWKVLSLSNADVDALLSSPKVQLLKRFRHGTFHFQKTYFDERFANFMRLGGESRDWADDLSGAFGAFFLRWHETHTPDGGPKP
jgi:hypothetical protein